MKNTLKLCVVAMVVSVVMFSGCELLPLNESGIVSTEAQINEAADIKEVAVGALTAAKDAAVNVATVWTAARVAKVAGEGTGIGGLVTVALLAYRLMRRKDVLLKSAGRVIEDFSRADPSAGGILKTALAKAAAKIPIDAKKEFGV